MIVCFDRLAPSHGLAAKYRNRSDFSLDKRTMDSFNTSFRIPLGHLLSIACLKKIVEISVGKERR